MKRKFSDDDLLRFLYNEMHPADSEQLMEALVKDEELLERYESFQQIAEQVGEINLQPSQQSLDKVMAFVHESGSPVLLDYPVEEPTGWQRFKMNSGKSVVVGLNSLILFGVGIFLLVAVGTSSLPWHQQHEHAVASVESPDLSLDLSWDDPEIRQELQEIEKSVQRLRLKPVL